MTPSNPRSDSPSGANRWIRAVSVAERRSWLRLFVTGVLSFFLFYDLGFAVGLGWLAVTLAVELVLGFARRRLLDGDLRYMSLIVGCMFGISLCWVIHAVLMWNVGGELPRIVAIMDLFTVSLYAAIGAYHDRRLMSALLAPPLLILSVLLITTAWTGAALLPAVFYTMASLGAVATIIWNAMSLNQVDQELVTSNQSLEAAIWTARAANASKDQFLSNMSHELRTPLNGIIGIGAALSNAPLPERERDMARLIKISGESLERLVSDLLDLAKIEAGKLSLENDRIELGPLLHTAAGLHREAVEAKGIRFAVEVASAADGAYLGDAVRLRQIITNLVSNALKFTSSGEIRVLADADDAGLTITVSDTGIGFDAEAGERLFQRFEQADASITRRYGGSGLGLSICRALCREMGGEITARSNPGEGSEFVVRLPLVRCDAAHETPQTGLPGADEAVLEGGGLRVLLAEDHEINRLTIAYMLELSGVSLTQAVDGQEAVAAYLAGDFDVVLMDMQMPLMDGLAATRAIRAIEAQSGRERTPIAMLTANAMDEHVAQAIAAGCDIHLTKPITPERLFAGLNAALSQGAALASRQIAV